MRETENEPPATDLDHTALMTSKERIVSRGEREHGVVLGFKSREQREVVEAGLPEVDVFVAGLRGVTKKKTRQPVTIRVKF